MKKIFLGPPGSGKGTAASRVAPIKNIPHISTGELFRQNIKQGTEIGLKAKQYMETGNLVPDEVVIGMLKNRIEQDDCKNGFILDGFPRTLPQAEMLKQIIGADIAINLDVSDEIVIKRLNSRKSCSQCGEIYNTRTMPTKQEGICDKCQGEVITRPDDEPETIKKRLETYKEQTFPLIKFYEDLGILKNVTCTNIDQTAEETLNDVLNAIEEFTKDIKDTVSETFGSPNKE